MTSESHPGVVCKSEAYRVRKSTNAAAWRAEARSDVLDVYGRECACCDEGIERFLTIDHIDGNGSEHRKTVSHAKLYNWLRNQGYPDGFQVLCSSCNAGRHINGGECPHVAPVLEPVSYAQRYRRKLKLEVIKAYGGECACCAEAELTFLTIDHVNGGGTKHRKEVSPTKLYRWLRDNPVSDEYQALCFNCNDGVHFNGGTCPHKDVR